MIPLLACLSILLVSATSRSIDQSIDRSINQPVVGWPHQLINQPQDRFHQVTPESAELYRVVYHTENNEFVPGCARTFMFQSIHQPINQSINRSIKRAFNVTVERLFKDPLISSQYNRSINGGSINDYNFNAAYVPIFVKSNDQSIDQSINQSQEPPHIHHALLLRTQNRTSQSTNQPINQSVKGLASPSKAYESTNQSINQSVEGLASPSMLFMAYELPNHPGIFAPVTYDDLSLYPIDSTDSFGVEDPRIVFDDRTQEWVLLYTAVATINQSTIDQSTNHQSTINQSTINQSTINQSTVGAKGVMARLSLATTKNISDAKSWVRHGPIITDQWSKSGALLVRPLEHFNNLTSFLYWGDSNNGKGMSLAVTDNLRNFTTIDEVWMPIRKEPYFDNLLVEGGPAPERLSTGDFFYLFNSAGKLTVNKTDYTAYHLTFAIIDQKDPTVQLFRSPVPILSCELGWEIGTQPWLDLTPYVVFAEGMRPFTEKGPDSFLAYYGGADSVIGAAIITVKFENDKENQQVKYADE